MAVPRYRVREAGPADAEAVGRLQRQVGFKAHSPAAWRWLYEDNPARAGYTRPPAHGWVLEGEGEIAGYLGNIPQDYVADGQPLRAATCSGYVVLPRARGDSLKLLQAWFKQPEVTLFLSTTANEESEALYALCKAESPPEPSFRQGLVWVGADREALHEWLLARSLWGPLAAGLSRSAAPLSRLARRLSGLARVPDHPLARTVQVRGREAVDDRYDALWQSVCSQPGLRLRRDARTLRWLLSDPDAGPPAVLEASDDQGLAACALAAIHDPGPGRSLQLRLLDLTCRPGREDLAPALLRRAALRARQVGAGLLYAPPCGAELAALLDGLGGRPHPRGHQSHFLRARDRALTPGFVAPGRWRATGLDGDVPFCIVGPGLRPPGPGPAPA